MKKIVLLQVKFGLQVSLLFVFSFCKGNCMSETFYKIIPVSYFDKDNLENCTKPIELDIKSGFMHFSYKHQVNGVLQKFFNKFEQNNFVQIIILEIDPEVLQKNGSELRVEANKPGGEKYPHLYGSQKIPIKAVKKIKLV